MSLSLLVCTVAFELVLNNINKESWYLDTARKQRTMDSSWCIVWCYVTYQFLPKRILECFRPLYLYLRHVSHAFSGRCIPKTSGTDSLSLSGRPDPFQWGIRANEDYTQSISANPQHVALSR